MKTVDRPWLVIGTRVRGNPQGVGLRWVKTWRKTRGEARTIVRYLQSLGYHAGIELDRRR